MSKTISYRFTSSGNESKFYISPNMGSGIPSFSDLQVTELNVKNITIPKAFYSFRDDTKDSILFKVNGVNISINSGLTTIIDIVSVLNAEMILQELGGASLIPATVSEGNSYKTTAYRLKIDYIGALVVDYAQHSAAKAYGLEEVSLSGTSSYTFKIPIDDIVLFRSEIPTVSVKYVGIEEYESYQITLSEGDKSMDNLIDELTSQITGFPWVSDLNFSYDKQKRLTLTVTVTEDVTHVKWHASKTLGIPNDTIIQVAVNIATLECSAAVNMNLTTSINIKSNVLGKLRKDRTVLYPYDKYTLCSVPITERIFGKMLIANPDLNFVFSNPIKIPYIDFQLVDDENKLIDLNGFLWSITLTFTYIGNIVT